ncbi:sulfotransferase domain-containing protein [Pontibacter sp. G13]|uniref:sulfotransferase domain-containing protein n=1 Tax=Pontibacter sp. G13 TaxID=3074898 RepID=UPI002889D1AB|nr:sulfotransferase domain-containing protein [Pontibacter sp. G13]WNJ19749.1 sulfotransferase domain-containing protein [Pontibacter sp. G13]
MQLHLQNDVLSQLRHVRTFNNSTKVSGQFPDFLIVGPQRTGTTFLTANLRYHPELFLSNPKELYFFSRLTESPGKGSLHLENFKWKLASKNPQRFFREVAKVAYFDMYKTGSYKSDQLEWYMSFFKDDPITKLKKQQYFKQTFGAAYKPKVWGEATASYSVLPDSVIQDIVLLNPDIKAILMVRDPIKRAWSHAKKDLMRNAMRSYEEVPQDSWFEFFNREFQLKCADYVQNIQRWEKHLKPGNLKVCRFEDVKQKPHELLLDIHGFLGVTPDPAFLPKKDMQKSVNQTDKLEVPPKYHDYLHNLLNRQISELDTYVGSMASSG